MIELRRKMKIQLFIVFVYWCIAVCTCSPDLSLPTDTYVNALQNSHNSIDYDSNGGGYQYNPPPDNSYLPSDNSYLPPDNSYLPPATSPPVPVYGPPPLPYNSQPPVFYRPSYPTPYHTHDSFLDKLKSKISLLTIGKLLLKLLIFKKIVKFIGIICLLLVLPKLKNMFHDSMPMEDDGMSSKIVQTDQDQLQKHINEVYEFIMKSIQYLDEEST